jgi:hypothetical protein
MFLIYAVAMGAFAAMTPAFAGESKNHRLVYLVWYVVATLEAIAVVTISCCWRMLSFKKTHLMERMSLLTIIVIGEGAIGVTKTVSRLMGKHGLDVEGCFLIMCIIVILVSQFASLLQLRAVQKEKNYANRFNLQVFIWALYFDNFPHGHYGTIRQQIWSLLHFPFQLAIVGVVEGSQQLALARYTIKNAYKVERDLMDYCGVQQLDGAKLRDKLLYLLNYFELDLKMETKIFFKEAQSTIFKIGNMTGICAPEKAAQYMDGNQMWPDEFVNVTASISNGIYVGLGMKIPSKKLDDGSIQPLDIAVKSWELVYMYYWACFCLLVLILICFLLLIRRHKVDLFDFTSIISRFLVLGVGAALLALYADKTRLYGALSTPMLLPICVLLLFLILCSDKLSAVYCNWRLKKSGQPYAMEVEEHDHGHSSGHEAHTHGEVEERAPLQGHGYSHGHHDSVNLQDDRKEAHYSEVYSDVTSLSATNTEYKSGSHYSEPMMSPPLLSPDPTTPGLGSKPSGPGGYMPVSTGQNYGA